MSERQGNLKSLFSRFGHGVRKTLVHCGLQCEHSRLACQLGHTRALECPCLGYKTPWPRFVTVTISLKMSTRESKSRSLVISAAKMCYSFKLHPQLNSSE